MSGVLTTPLIPVMINKLGRKCSLIIGFSLLIISNSGLGALSYFEPGQWKSFYAVSIATRFLQGFADSLTMSVIFALVSNNYVEDRSRYISYVKAAGGLGLMLGPSMGSTIYGYLGYARTFYFFSLLLVLGLILSAIFVVEPKLNRNEIIEQF